MRPVITNQGGLASSAGPDVCKVPAGPSMVPMPLMNMAMMNQATGVSMKVKFGGKQVVTVASKVPVSNGDEPGTGGGLVSGKFKGECTFKLGSLFVRVEGKMPVRQGDPCAMNGTVQNIMGMIAGPGCLKVMVS